MSPEILRRLRPWQIEPAQQLFELFRQGQNAVDCSDCGVGKTYTACAVMAALKLPTLAIVPKIAQTQWEIAAAHFGESISVIGYEKLRTGRTPYGAWEKLPSLGEDRNYFQCQCCQLRVDFENYQPCHCHPLGIHCVIERKVAWNYGKFTFHPAVRFVIFDEIQRCGALDSLNADMLTAAKRQGLRVLGLSATLATSPLQLKALGYVLGLYPSPRDFVAWASRYGVRYDGSFRGLHWFAGEEKQLGTMREIRANIIPRRGVRVAKADIPGFPEVDISAEIYDIDNVEQLQRVHEQMAEALEKFKDRSSRYAATALTELMTGHQRAELLKVPLAIELAQDYLEKGFSIGIFVNFRPTMEELRERLKCDCVIDGSAHGIKYRARSIEAFQTHKSRLILINNTAGGVALSLPDLDGNHPRGGLVFPGHSAEKIRQVVGRFPRENSKSRSFYRILLAAKTGDIKIHKALRRKLNCLDALLDEDLQPDNLTIASA